MGNPNWILPTSPAPTFTRDGIGIQGFNYHTELRIEADCAPSAADPNFCTGGAAVEDEPGPVCELAGHAGYVQTAYDECCPVDVPAGGAGCVGPDG